MHLPRFYNGQTRRILSHGNKKENLVTVANDFAQACGLASPPPLLPKTIGKMGEHPRQRRLTFLVMPPLSLSMCMLCCVR